MTQREVDLLIAAARLRMPAEEVASVPVPAPPRDAVQQSGEDSFPASDPPGWWAG